MASLSHDDIHKIYEAAIDAGLANKRSILFAGIDQNFVASLVEASSPAEQLILDLHMLNNEGRLQDDSVPIRMWLKTAVLLTQSRKVASVFQEALDKYVQIELSANEKSTHSQIVLEAEPPTVVPDKAHRSAESTLPSIDWKNPGAVLAAALKAVPVMKYALAVAGVTAVVTMATRGFGLDRGTAVVGSLIAIAFMVLLLVLAAVARQQNLLRLPAQVLTWAFLLMAISSSGLLLASFFFHTPRSPRCLFHDECEPVTPGTAPTTAQLRSARTEDTGVLPMIHDAGVPGPSHIDNPYAGMRVGQTYPSPRPSLQRLQHAGVAPAQSATSEPSSQVTATPPKSIPEMPSPTAKPKGQDLCRTTYCP